MRILKVSPKNLKRATKEAIKSIKKGEVIICPTDTVYGLIADASDEQAVKKIFKIKKRKKQKALPIFVKDVRMAERLALINREQKFFLKKAWPGEITVILKRNPSSLPSSPRLRRARKLRRIRKSSKLPKIVFGQNETIGIRIPKYKLVSILLEKLKIPLVGTSANISGKSGSNKIKKVLNQFKKQKFQPNLVIDAGNLKKNKPSTIIDLTGSDFKILRTGRLSKEKLLKKYGRFYFPKNK